MKSRHALLVTLAGNAFAFPHSTSSFENANSLCDTVSLNSRTNIWESYRLHTNVFYRDRVVSAAAAIHDPLLKQKALRVADVGSFIWLNTPDSIETLNLAIADVPCGQIVGLVLQGIEDRECTGRRFQPTTLATYQEKYINPLIEILASNPTTAFAVILEPESLPIMVTNADISSCKGLADSYRRNVAYALQKLNLPNVIIYLDAGHGGWLGWDDNLRPAAEELATIFQAAGHPSQVRGIAVNVAGWNSWDSEPGEFEYLPDGQYNRAQNEKKFVQLLGNALHTAGFPNHAIIDTSRNGVIGIREEWGNWCNVNGAGFGVRPTAHGTGLELADAFVWVAGGGFSDGTSNTSSVNYDSFCGKADAFKPSPEAGEWNQAYFEMLLENARPPINIGSDGI